MRKDENMRTAELVAINRMVNHMPVFAGYDLDLGVGRIYSYDVTGGRYEEHRHHAVGRTRRFRNRGWIIRSRSAGGQFRSQTDACQS